MTAQPIRLAGAALTACASGALWWEAERLLCVADLHLGKSERMARRGGALLPPYETEETVARLAAEVGGWRRRPSSASATASTRAPPARGSRPRRWRGSRR